MDNFGDTHYVSFLSGDGAATGYAGCARRSHRPSRTLAGYAWRKRLGGLPTKVNILIAAVVLSLLMCFVFLLLTRQTPQEIIPLMPMDGDGNSDAASAEQFPEKISDWNDSHFSVAFSRFMDKYSKTYVSLEEKQRRFRIFRSNLVYIYLHNEQGHSFELDMNQFGDWSRDEFREMVGGYKKNPESSFHSRLGVDKRLLEDHSTLPVSIDWREVGCVTPTKDQGACGSCWAFSTTGAVEGAWCAKTGKLVSLSEQMLMDCSGYLGNNSCNGGMMDDGFTYITQHGLCSEDAYPYEAHDDKCRENKCSKKVGIKGFYDIPPENENAMRAAIARHGPVSIAIQADQVDFQFYRRGVFDAPCGADLDHGVLLVGYGTDHKTKKDFFVMKNSWGVGWGDNGYMYMAQHKGQNGECGLLLSGSYPLAIGERPPE